MKSRIRARINKPMLVFDILSKYLKKKECILSLLKTYDIILKKYYIVLEGDTKNLVEFNFISICSKKNSLITPCFG